MCCQAIGSGSVSYTHLDVYKRQALAWALRDERVTSVLIGASSVAQLENSIGATANLDFTDAELRAIDRHAVESGVNLWARSSSN